MQPLIQPKLSFLAVPSSEVMFKLSCLEILFELHQVWNDTMHPDNSEGLQRGGIADLLQVLVEEKILDPVNPYPYVDRYLLSDCPDWYSDLWDRT